MLILVIKDLNRVKSAVFYVWKYSVEGNGLKIMYSTVRAAVNAFPGSSTMIKQLLKTSTTVSGGGGSPFSSDGTRDSAGYTAVGFNVVVK